MFTSISNAIKAHLWETLLAGAFLGNFIGPEIGDLFFVLILLTSVIVSVRNGHGTFFKIFQSLRWFNILIAVWVIANIIGYSTSSNGLNPEKIEEIFGLRWILSIYGCIFAGYNVEKISFSKIKKIIYLFLALIAVSIFYQWSLRDVPGQYSIFYRLQGFYRNPNNFALALLIPWACLFTVLIKHLESYDHKKNHLFAAFLILTATLYFTYTRSAWIAMVACLFVLIVITRSKKILFGTIPLIAGAALFYIFDVFKFKERILYTYDVSKNSSSGVRLMLWKVNWHIFLDHPLFGVGFLENLRLLPSYYDKMGLHDDAYIAHAHNQFLQIIVGSGIVGLAAYLGIFILSFRFFYQHFNNSKNKIQKFVAMAGIMVITAFLVGGLFESPLTFREPRNFLILFAGSLTGYLLKFRGQSEKTI